MAASIVLVGLGAQYPNPGTFIEVDFAQGPAAGSGSPRYALIMGNKTAAGSATVDTVVYGPDTPVTCQTENDVITLFGTGSQVHRAFLRFTRVNQTTPLYMMAVTESAGASATVTETIATTATSNGNKRTWCVDEFVDTPISSGDTASTIAANVVTSVNSMSRWPVTASAVGAVITYIARNRGPEGNWIRMQSLITPGTSTVGTTTTLTANTFLSGGTTADSNTTALSTLVSSKYYGIISCDSDATNVGRIVSQINTQAQPTNGLRQRAFFGSMDTLANTITLATGINSPRAECIWGSATDWMPLELAANNCALYMLLEQGAQFGVARKNFALFPSSDTDQTLWFVTGGRNGVGGAPTPAQITSALNNGLSPIGMYPNGKAYLVDGITTRSLNGTTADSRIRDRHKVSICDYFGDDLQAVLQLNFGGKELLPDPTPGTPFPATATSPTLIGNAAKALVDQYGRSGQWGFQPGFSPSPGQTPADVINANMIVQQESNPPTRVSILVQATPVQVLKQVAALVQQIA